MTLLNAIELEGVGEAVEGAAADEVRVVVQGWHSRCHELHAIRFHFDRPPRPHAPGLVEVLPVSRGFDPRDIDKHEWRDACRASARGLLKLAGRPRGDYRLTLADPTVDPFLEELPCFRWDGDRAFVPTEDV
eukprot:Hpha_TRINITY_DN17908_c0_g1::TRINITY_DN17908_c0_g1_i1::g.33709::m.33709